MWKNTVIEICADSIDSARIAESAGAQRVELCTNLAEGGTTPAFALIEMARKFLTIKLYVLIRPRGGDFFYNDLEFELMKSDIRQCGKMGCDGVVTGILNVDGRVDMQRCRELVKIAESYSMGVTFHRALDRCADIFQGLEDVISIGCERVLTSGGADTAVEGVAVIKRLVEQAYERIAIMIGAGVTPENISELVKKTGVNEVHGTFRSRQNSAMSYKNTKLSNQEQEYGIWLADAEKIRKVIELI